MRRRSDFGVLVRRQCAVGQVDATDFSEIGTISTEGRCVLDLCVDAADNYIGLVTLEPNELMSCSARVYEVGRRRMQVRLFSLPSACHGNVG